MPVKETQVATRKPLWQRGLAALVAATALATGGTLVSATPASAASPYLINTVSRKCLDADPRGWGNGSRVYIWDCNYSYQQRWGTFGQNDGFQLWVAMNGTVGSTMCLDADANNGANGARVQLWQCNGSLQQTWRAGSNYGGAYFRNSKFGKCLDADLNHIYENGGRGADVGL
jgi:hypothetical protein